MAEKRSASPEQLALAAQLIDAGLLIPSGVDGVYGHSETFERIRLGLEALISARAKEGGAIQLRFPPLMPVTQLISSGYLSNMPHLTGTVFSFDGNDADAQTQAALASAGEDWSRFQHPTEVALTPAACYPVYPAIAQRGRLPPGGVFVDAGGSWVFRHEPSQDPARRQMFHQHELVRIGEPDTVLDWRAEWSSTGLALLESLGLRARLEGASDPFFGRRRRLLASSQREQDLKLELLVDIAGPEPTACASFNHHLNHFGSIFGLETSDGAVAHTACLGFGQERIVLALLARHGLEPERWPDEVFSAVTGG